MADSEDSSSQVHDEQTSVQGAESSVTNDLFVSGLVKPSEFKPKSGHKNVGISSEEKIKMLAMVKDLDKYGKVEVESKKSMSPQKTGDSHSVTEKRGTGLFDFLDSELSCLHLAGNHENVGSSKYEKKDHKPVPHVSSVSVEQQKQFESLLKGDLDLSASTDTCKESKSVVDSYFKEQKDENRSAGEKELKVPRETLKKMKNRQEKKDLERNEDGHIDGGPKLGSYSQLMISMGRKSPHRKIEIVQDSVETCGLPSEAENQQSGKKKRNRKKKGNQQAEAVSPAVEESQQVAPSVKEREHSAGRKKKGKSLHSARNKQELIATADGSQSTFSDRFACLVTPEAEKNPRRQNKKHQHTGLVMDNTEVHCRQQKQSDSSKVGQGQSMLVDHSAFVEASVYLPKTDHWFVIGPQGKHLSEILNETGVTVSVPKLNSKSDEIVLRGDRNKMGLAMSMMFTLCEQAKMESQYRQSQSHFPVGQVVSQPHKHLGSQQHRHQFEGHQGSRQFEGHQRTRHGQQQGHDQRRQGQHGRPVTPKRDVDKGQGKRQRNKKAVFADYMSKEDLTEGLKTGDIIQGPIRINPRNYEESYVPHPDGRSDILISGLKSRNRALNGDIVAVKILDEGEWKVHNNELAGMENAVDDSDPEVVIESEEIVEVIGSEAATAKSEKETKMSGPSKQVPALAKNIKESKTTGNSPKKRFTTYNEMMAEDSPIKKTMATESGREKVKKLLQRTGVVVGIVEKRSTMTCAGHIKLMQDKNPNRALFHPNDHRMPRVIIPMCDCPKDFFHRPEDYASTLYVCKIIEWKQDNIFSEGCLVKRLGEAGEIEPETEGMLYENEVDFSEFPEKALQCLPATPWSIPASEFDYRRDFRSSCVFTIDPATARDLDDALSCEDLGDGNYKIGVHIADVSYFVRECTGLDEVACSRSTSVYLVHKVVPMLPRLLCEQLCSLNPDEDRLSFSVEWTMNEKGEIENEWFGRSVIRSCVKLAYDHAQGFIEEPDRVWTEEELPPVSDGFTIEDIKSRVLAMHRIAVNLRKARMEGGALRLDQIKLQYSLDPETGLPNGYSVYHQKDSNRLVEEFMLLANMAVAHKINSHFPDSSILRKHPPPQEKMVDSLKEQCSALGIHLDTSGAGALQASLRNYAGDDEISKARMQVLVALCAKPMQNAEYFCTGCLDDESLYHHYALNVPLYTHFTSPIRRYPDILVHRLLGAALDYCEKPSRSPGELETIAKYCNDKKTAAKRVGDLSSDLFFAVFVKIAGPLEERAMVMGVLDKAFDIYVLELGVTKRVYCDKLPIKEKIFKQDSKVPSLILVWEGMDGEPDVRQEITIFSLVDCVLDKGELPLQWTAVIKRPQPVIL